MNDSYIQGECIINFSLKISNIKIPLTFFKEVFTDTLCVEGYADPRLNRENWTVILACKNWTVEAGLEKLGCRKLDKWVF